MVKKKSEIKGAALFSGIENTLTLETSSCFKISNDGVEFKIGQGSFYAENSCSHWLNKHKTLTLVEHVLACAHFSDPFELKLKHREIPLLDGSSKPYWDWIVKNDLNKKPELYDCDVAEEWSWKNGYFKIEPSDKFEVDYRLKRDGFSQQACWDSEESPEVILESRTFIFESQLKERMSQNLFKGAQKGMSIVLDENALPLDEELRNSKELVRHKILDLLGDLALVRLGLPKLKITCLNGNHKENHNLAERILLNVASR